jgi:hypothetical protein
MNILHHRDSHILAAVLFSFTAFALMPAAASTMTASPGSIDFGDVAVGASVTVPVTITISLAPGEQFISLTEHTFLHIGASSDSEIPVDFLAPDCSQTIFSCTADVTFKPTFPDPRDTDIAQLEFDLEIFNSNGLRTEGGQADVVLTGTAVPGPVVGAGLPGLIFAGAGLLGWWRRKPKAVAAA